MNLASVDFRRRLPNRKEYFWQKLEKGVYVGYRSINATWHARFRKDGKTIKRFVGAADTLRDADGETVFTYRDAIKKAYALQEAHDPEPARSKLTVTVADVCSDYLDYAKARTKSARVVGSIIRVHILPELGRIPAEKLTGKRIEQWMNAFASSRPQARPRIIANPATGRTKRIPKYRESTGIDEHESLRKRQASANRAWNVLRAALARAWKHGDLKSAQWQKAEPFEGASKPVERFLTESECRRLLKHMDEDFARIAMALLLSGARFGEMRHTRVRDYQRRQASLIVTRPKKRGTGTRVIALSEDADTLFSELTAERDGAEHIFLRSDGSPWGDGQQYRRMHAACDRAGIDPPVGVHVLRHSVASHLHAGGLGLKLISEALGHSNVSVTGRVYVHLEDSQLRRELDRHGMKLVKPAKVETLKQR